MPEMSAEERASRMETLVAALPAEQWGERTAPATVSSAPPPLTADDSPAAPDRPPRPGKFDKEVYEGASDLEDSSDDEAMPEGEERLGGDEVEGEDGPSVLNEDDVLDLGEEMDEFLKFATETLGLTPAQYEKILQDRRGRGGASRILASLEIARQTALTIFPNSTFAQPSFLVQPRRRRQMSSLRSPRLPPSRRRRPSRHLQQQPPPATLRRLASRCATRT